MKPLPKFELHKPTSLREALNLLSNLKDAKPIAGGTDILPLMRDGMITTKHLIDLKGLDQLHGIIHKDDEIRIGALTTLAETAESKIIAEKSPILKDAAVSVGCVQTRNQGTVVGNLCNASPAADTAPALLVLDALITVVSEKNTKKIPLIQLFKGPKMNSLNQEELVTEIKFSLPPKGSGASFKKLGRRKGYTLSVVNAAAYLKLDDDFCEEARVALGAVAATPLRMQHIEELLQNKKVSESLIKKASLACHGLIEPIDDVRSSAKYRREMSCVLMKRALMEAFFEARRT